MRCFNAHYAPQDWVPACEIRQHDYLLIPKHGWALVAEAAWVRSRAIPPHMVLLLDTGRRLRVPATEQFLTRQFATQRAA